MFTLLLVVIYLSFISLGLPDSLLGAAWPVMGGALGVPVSAAGVLTIIVSSGTIVSSAVSGKLLKKFRTGTITAVSTAMTAVALLGYSFAPGFWFLCIMAVPLGLGAGAVDSALNNFISLHYKARHMNWLHCFWGLGATVGPLIMSAFILKDNGWRLGYRTVSIIQMSVATLLFLSLFFWNSAEKSKKSASDLSVSVETVKNDAGFLGALRLPGAAFALLSFFFYCSIESTVGIWGSTFLVRAKGISADTAAQWVSFYFFGITVGRFVSGFLSMKINNKNMVYIGVFIMGVSILLFALSLNNTVLMLGFILAGLGCSPIFPALIHNTPRMFGKENSQTMTGLQMAGAYTGATLLPPVYGLIADKISPAFFPYFLIILFVLINISLAALFIPTKRAVKS